MTTTRRRLYKFFRMFGLHILHPDIATQKQYRKAVATAYELQIKAASYKSYSRDFIALLTKPGTAMYIMDHLLKNRTYMVRVVVGTDHVYTAVYDTTVELHRMLGYSQPKGFYIAPDFRYQVIGGRMRRAAVDRTEQLLFKRPFLITRSRISNND